jgi:hypothetical protein
VKVLDNPATLAAGRALPSTRTGFSPAGSRQLRLAHANKLLIMTRSAPDEFDKTGSPRPPYSRGHRCRHDGHLYHPSAIRR